jgi:hypothetical protein
MQASPLGGRTTAWDNARCAKKSISRSRLAAQQKWAVLDCQRSPLRYDGCALCATLQGSPTHLRKHLVRAVPEQPWLFSSDSDRIADAVSHPSASSWCTKFRLAIPLAHGAAGTPHLADAGRRVVRGVAVFLTSRIAASQFRDVAGFRLPVDTRRHMRRLRPGILFVAVQE